MGNMIKVIFPHCRSKEVVRRGFKQTEAKEKCRDIFVSPALKGLY